MEQGIVSAILVGAVHTRCSLSACGISPPPARFSLSHFWHHQHNTNLANLIAPPPNLTSKMFSRTSSAKRTPEQVDDDLKAAFEAPSEPNLPFATLSKAAQAGHGRVAQHAPGQVSANAGLRPTKVSAKIKTPAQASRQRTNGFFAWYPVSLRTSHSSLKLPNHRRTIPSQPASASQFSTSSNACS